MMLMIQQFIMSMSAQSREVGGRKRSAEAAMIERSAPLRHSHVHLLGSSQYSFICVALYYPE